MNAPESNQKDASNAENSDVQGACEDKELDIVTSPLAVFSCVLGIFALLFSISAVISFPSGGSYIAPILAAGTVGLAWMAFFLGIVSLCQIGKAGGMLTGKGFAVIGIVIPLGLFWFVIFKSGVRGPHPPRLYCGTNLSGIGKAMLIYSNDYDDEFPRAGRPDSAWGRTSNFEAATAAEAYGLNDGAGQASISANFYLLVKYADVTPKSFLCKGDKKTNEFTLAKYKVRNKELVDLWDFGPDPSKHCSYSYHIPYGPSPLTPSDDPGLALAADRNPWLRSPGAKPRRFESFDPTGDRKAIKAGNTRFHKEDGQNVLFIDGHVSFEKSSACGVNDDNIYTSQNGPNVRKGVLPTLTSQPGDSNDSLLLHDPPRGAKK